MYADWDEAHVDYTSPPARLVPVGLAASETSWRERLEQTTPGGWLLRGNSMTQTLVNGGPLYLMHTTVALEAIRASGQLYASSGCLVAAIYCAPLAVESGGLRPHNLGAHLLQTRPRTHTLVFQVAPDGPAPAAGIDYLRLGRVHLAAYRSHRSFLTAVEDERLRAEAMARLTAAAPFLDELLANATGHPTDVQGFIDRLSSAISSVPFLGYLYFEVLSEYLMLHSTSAETKIYAQRGEMNNLLYKRLAFAAVEGMDRLFDLARFRPGHDRLVELIGHLESRLAAGVAPYVRERLSHLFTTIALDPSLDADGGFSFRGLDDFEVLTRTAPSLIGQMVFRELRTFERYPHLYLAFEQAKALQAWEYWNRRNIAAPFNGFLPKGEIGLNPAYPHGQCTVWVAEQDEQGLLHPVEQLEVTPAPRLAELNMTAMRRDETGKAAGHTALR